ncbi:MAG: phytanoyl-CoA dioxygenase family protein [Planctomycetota bacterium]
MFEDHDPDLVTATDRAAYERDGVWFSPVLFGPDEIAHLRAEVQRLYAGERDFDADRWPGRRDPIPLLPGRMANTINGWWVNAGVRAAVFSPRVAACAATLMGADRLRLLHDQVMSKQPVDPEAPEDGNVGWHQDYAHWTITRASRYCTAWIALQDTDLDNGAVRFVRGSHHWGLMRESATFGTRDLDTLRARFGQGRDWEEVPAVLQAGQVSFHDGLTMHGSTANRGSAPRQAILVNVMTDDATYDRDGHPNQISMQFGPWVHHGQRLGDPWFPLLWPPTGSPAEAERGTAVADGV